MKFIIKANDKSYPVDLHWHNEIEDIIGLNEVIDTFRFFFKGARAAGNTFNVAVIFAQRDTNEAICCAVDDYDQKQTLCFAK